MSTPYRDPLSKIYQIAPIECSTSDLRIVPDEQSSIRQQFASAWRFSRDVWRPLALCTVTFVVAVYSFVRASSNLHTPPGGGEYTFWLACSVPLVMLAFLGFVGLLAIAMDTFDFFARRWRFHRWVGGLAEVLSVRSIPDDRANLERFEVVLRFDTGSSDEVLYGFEWRTNQPPSIGQQFTLWHHPDHPEQVHFPERRDFS